MSKKIKIVGILFVLAIIGSAFTSEDSVTTTAVETVAQVESSRIEGRLQDGRLWCKNSVRKLAKYPTKVKYKGWTEGNIVENYTKNAEFPDRFWINFEGEWMNGYGNMVPFTAHCKLDTNSDDGKIVDIWIK